MIWLRSTSSHFIPPDFHKISEISTRRSLCDNPKFTAQVARSSSHKYLTDPAGCRISSAGISTMRWNSAMAPRGWISHSHKHRNHSSVFRAVLHWSWRWLEKYNGLRFMTCIIVVQGWSQLSALYFCDAWLSVHVSDLDCGDLVGSRAGWFGEMKLGWVSRCIQ